MARKKAITLGDLQNSDRIIGYSDEPGNVEMIFGFLEEVEASSGSSCDSRNKFDNLDLISPVDDEEEEDENSCNGEENKVFWESQAELLQMTLRRTSSLETKIRQATKEAIRELNSGRSICNCGRPVANGCRSCMQREVSARLRSAGYDCAICKSKWRSSPDIPSGEHAYLEVANKPSSKKGEVRVIIELNLRGEFEMARASEAYNQLVNQLPEVYVGKIERLRAVIKILCCASKKCMKERKMHMAPWRKQKYMQAKWIGMPQQKLPAPILPAEQLNRLPRPRASLLTFDLLENFPGLHSPAIKVL